MKFIKYVIVLLLGIMILSAVNPVMAKAKKKPSAVKESFKPQSGGSRENLLLFGSVSNPNFPIEDLVDLAQLNLKGKSYFFNGNYQKGELKENNSAYITLTLYKGVKYALAVGANSALTNLTVNLYDEATNTLVHYDTIGKNSYKAFLINADHTGNYYLKITANGVKPDKKAEWMYLYGFKN